MFFHLLTIQNQNSDDTVFHGLDYDSLRLQVAAYCREEWHHGMARDEPLPLDQEEQIEAFFLDHDRLFLTEQEFPLPQPYASAPDLLTCCQKLVGWLRGIREEHETLVIEHGYEDGFSINQAEAMIEQAQATV